MKKFKKILTCSLLVLIIFIATGCANIEYSRVLDTDGTILDAVSVKLENNKITNAGYNIDTVTDNIKTMMNNYIDALVRAFRNRDDGLGMLEKQTVLYNSTRLVSVQNGYIIASIKFRNFSTFQYFYGLHLIEDTNDNTKTIKGFLYDKNVTTGKTIFSGADAEFLTNEFLTYFNNDFTLNDANLSYVFGTPENKLHSNSMYEFEKDGVNYHQWIITNTNQEISTFTFTMKPINWYILALALTFVLIIVLYIVSIFYKKKNNKTNININDN